MANNWSAGKKAKLARAMMFVLLGAMGTTIIILTTGRRENARAKVEDDRRGAEKNGGPSEDDLKKRSRSLSAEMLTFLSDRNRSSPPLPRPGTWQQDVHNQVRFMEETMDQYQVKFGARVIAVHDDFAKRGLRDEKLDKLYEYPANPMGVRMLGERIGALAERLP
jgi:hypothetical protein